MDDSIRHLSAQLLQPALSPAGREALEDQLLTALEQRTNAEAVLRLLRTETNQMALFVAVELLAKASLKQGVCGINKHFLLPPQRADEPCSEALLAKKRLIDAALEVLEARRLELEERLVDMGEQVDSLCNLVGAGLKTNWLELSALESYAKTIEARFFARQERLLVLVGRQG